LTATDLKIANVSLKLKPTDPTWKYTITNVSIGLHLSSDEILDVRANLTYFKLAPFATEYAKANAI